MELRSVTLARYRGGIPDSEEAQALSWVEEGFRLGCVCFETDPRNLEQWGPELDDKVAHLSITAKKEGFVYFAEYRGVFDRSPSDLGERRKALECFAMNAWVSFMAPCYTSFGMMRGPKIEVPAVPDEPALRWAIELWSPDDEHARALDFVYGYLNDELCAGRFRSIDIFLDALDPTKLPATVIVAVLIGTLGSISSLSRRVAFIERSRPILELEPEGVDEVLRGLE